MMRWGFPDGGFWTVGLFGLMGTVLWVAVIVLVVFLVMRLIRGPQGPGSHWYGGTAPTHGPGAGPESPEEILHRRLATGDIDTEEYEKRLAALRANRPGGT